VALQQTKMPAEEALRRGAPLGSAGWVERMARRFGLHTTLRPRGRPKKETENGS
jgi:putative transposase